MTEETIPHIQPTAVARIITAAIGLAEASGVEPGNLSDHSASDYDLLLEMIRVAAQIANDARRDAALHKPNRERYGPDMKLSDLAALSGISRQTLALTLNGQRKEPPDLMTLARLARAAGKKLKLSLGD